MREGGEGVVEAGMDEEGGGGSAAWIGEGVCEVVCEFGWEA